MRPILIIDNTYSYLKDLDQDTNKILWKQLRFRERNYWHSGAFKSKRWDGYRDFYKEKTGRFLTGLLPEIIAALDIFNIKHEVVDKRQQVEFLHQKIEPNFLQQWQNPEDKPIVLYDYQVDYINQIIEFHRGIVSAPTASGKSLVMAGLLKTLKPTTPSLVLSNTKSVCDQNYDVLNGLKFKSIGRLYDKYSDPNIITVATVQSLHKIERLLGKIRVLIVDEIHEMASKVPIKFYEKMKMASVRLAVSATPVKFAGEDKVQKYTVKGHFGPILKTNCIQEDGSVKRGILSINTLQNRGILSKDNCVFFKVDKPSLPYAIYQDAVVHGIVRNFDFNKNKVSKLAICLEGRTLILVERLEHGDLLNSLIPNSLWVQGKDNLKTRKFVIDKLRTSKETTVAIATVKIFNTGLSFHIHNLINAAGGKAAHMITQRLGRGLRVSSDKDRLNYYDFYFTNNDYLLEHSTERVSILENNGHKVVIKDELEV